MSIFLLASCVAIIVGYNSYKTLSQTKENAEYVKNKVKPISVTIMFIDRKFSQLNQVGEKLQAGSIREKSDFSTFESIESKLFSYIENLKVEAANSEIFQLRDYAIGLESRLKSYKQAIVKIKGINKEFSLVKTQIKSTNSKIITNFENLIKQDVDGTLGIMSSSNIADFYNKWRSIEGKISRVIGKSKGSKTDIKEEMVLINKNLEQLDRKYTAIGSSEITKTISEIKNDLSDYSNQTTSLDVKKKSVFEIQNEITNLVKKIQGGGRDSGGGLINECLMAYNFQMDSKLQNMGKVADDSSRTIFMILLIGITIVLIVGGMITYRLVISIHELEAKALDIAAGNLDQTIEVKSTDELGVFATAFNSMLSNIKAMMENESNSKLYLQQQITLLSKIIKKASDGDFASRITQNLDGEMEKLGVDFNVMVDNLSELIMQVAKLVERVVDSSENINTIAKEQSAGAKIQSLKISDTSVAMEELTVSIQQVSDNAEIAEREALRATEVAVTGGLAVQKTIDGMKNIRFTVQETAKKIKGLGESSQEIGEIVEVIGDIAEQTNLLALNAAIEAARAGEHGRGFAVVADEIRVLADRSGKAAKEIEILIKRIQSETNESVMAMEQGTKGVLAGTQLADEAGLALKQIVEVVTKTNEVIREISLASKQQATASEEVVVSMENISEITKSVTQRSDTTFDAATGLKQVSMALKKSIIKFKVIDEEKVNDSDA